MNKVFHCLQLGRIARISNRHTVGNIFRKNKTSCGSISQPPRYHHQHCVVQASINSPPFLKALRMASSSVAKETELILTPLRVAVQEQGNEVRRLKAAKRPQLEVQAAVAELKVRKKALEQKEAELAPKEEKFERNKLEDLIKRRFMYAQSFSIYGGVGGLFDYGPMGCAIKECIISLWRSHFILEDNMLEVDCSILTPEYVLKASGHVERFSDLMVKDLTTGDCYRADHLLKDHLEQLNSDPKCTPDKAKEYTEVITKVDNYTQPELEKLFDKYSIKSPLSGNPLSPPMTFNLMFSTSIGPGGALPGFLRPETSQGIFVNFKRLLEFNNGKLPFAAAQIGRAFRNEISPRSGLLRVREFEMAEIAYFVNPEKKDKCSKFPSVASLRPTLYSSCDQMEGKSPSKVTIGDAVSSGVIGNAALAYFIGRIYLFLLKVGVAPERLRFRQHMSNEMAHYAKDCWDAECKTSYGWVECVGCADRSCFDLAHHSKATKVDLSAQEDLQHPRVVDVVEVVPDKGKIGKQFRKEAKAIMEGLSILTKEAVQGVESQLQQEGSAEIAIGDKTYTLTSDMISVKSYQKTIHVEDVVPSVIEPSFGLGRILYTVLEHSFQIREGDEQRVWLALPPSVSPINCSVLPLSNKEQFNPFISELVCGLKGRGLSHRVDDHSVSIGRRYARTDEIGIPFGITVDFDTIKTSSVTLRERNSTRQVRIAMDEVVGVVSDLTSGRVTWDQVEKQFPIFMGQDSTH